MMTTIVEDYRAALAASSGADPYAVLADVVAAVPACEVRRALADALHALTPTICSNERRTIRDAMHRSVGSPRWQAVAATQRALLRMRLATERGHIFLGDADLAEVRRQASIRREHAAATIAQAAWFEAIAKAMVTHGVLVVGELPDGVLDNLEDAA
jgi:hypothetical protein